MSIRWHHRQLGLAGSPPHPQNLSQSDRQYPLEDAEPFQKTIEESSPVDESRTRSREVWAQSLGGGNPTLVSSNDLKSGAGHCRSATAGPCEMESREQAIREQLYEYYPSSTETPGQ